MQIRITVLAFALSIAASCTLLASEIYKTIDSDGNVKFSDIPTVGAEHLDIRSRPTNRAAIQSEAQARNDTQTSEAQATASAPQGPTAEERQAEARERDELCNKYRARQSAFERNRRIYKMENGERVYYDEEEMQASRTGVDDKVQEYCN